MRRLFLISCVLGLCAACGSHSSSALDKHYRLTGEVKSLDAKDHTAQIDAAAIPNYMEAMSMDYPIKSEAEFKKLQVGELIEANLNVHGDDSYDLSDIRPSQAKK